MLVIACHAADRIAQLQDVVDKSGVLSRTKSGESASAAARELRLQTIVLARLLASIRVVGETEDSHGARPQRRSGFRGVYGGKEDAGEG